MMVCEHQNSEYPQIRVLIGILGFSSNEYMDNLYSYYIEGKTLVVNDYWHEGNENIGRISTFDDEYSSVVWTYDIERILVKAELLHYDDLAYLFEWWKVLGSQRP